jgi:hypothetical protein
MQLPANDQAADKDAKDCPESDNRSFPGIDEKDRIRVNDKIPGIDQLRPLVFK